MDKAQEMVRIGERLKQARERADLKREEVVAGLERVQIGVKASTIGNWEAGRHMPCLVHFRELCALYGEAPYRLLWGKLPLSITASEATELAAAVVGSSESLQRKVSVVLALLAETDKDHAEA